MALHSNPPVATHNITTHGSDLDWAICALHALLLLGVLGWAYLTAPRRRIFHYFALTILSVATIYYFIIASDLGGVGVRGRQVFYARWVGYFVNFSQIMFALLLLSGVGWASILFTIALVMLWATLFLAGMFVRSTYKWGFFVIAVVLYFLVVWQTLGIARSYARTIDTQAHRVFTVLAGWELGLMLLYPIAWAVSEGAGCITNDAEQIFYSVLDVLSQDVFAVALLALSRTLDFDLLHLAFTEYGRIREHVLDEKRAGAPQPRPGTTDSGVAGSDGAYQATTAAAAAGAAG